MANDRKQRQELNKSAALIDDEPVLNLQIGQPSFDDKDRSTDFDNFDKLSHRYIQDKF